MSVLLAPQHHGHRNGCGAAKVQGFRKGNLVECRREDSLLNLLGRGEICSTVCNPDPRVLAGKGLKVTLSSGVLFPPGGKCH